MKNLFRSKIAIGVASIVLLATAFSAGAFADSSLRQVTAYQNSEIQMTVNGQKVDLASSEGAMYPLVYNGHSYVSAKALVEAMGGSVHWNNDTQTVEVTTGSVGVPNKDNTEVKDGANSNSSIHTGSFLDPAPIGSSITFVDKDPSFHSTATFKVSVQSAAPISKEDVAAIDKTFVKDSPNIDYMIVELHVDASQVEVDENANKDGEFLSLIQPWIWGSYSSDNSSIYGCYNWHFNEALDDMVLKAADYERIHPGAIRSYQATGKVIIPVTHGKTSYLAIKKQDPNLNQQDSFLYFKLN